jgi:uncharacterized protein (TIGR03118 family)
VNRRVPRRALSLAAALVVATAVALAVRGRAASSPPDGYVVQRLASDRGDRSLVNAWGLAASPTGPWWTTSEATDVAVAYSGTGRKQATSVTVPGGPTGIAYNDGRGFRIRTRDGSDPAVFVYVCEDGRIRAWAPSATRSGWSTHASVVADLAAEAAVFRGATIAGSHLYATDFHNARVVVFDTRWRRVRSARAFVDPAIPSWYAPFGIQAIGDRVFVTYVWRAPVNGNDAPTGGYVDEFDRDGRLVARVAGRGAVNAPWGVALAPSTFGRFGGDLLVAGFGDGRIAAFRRTRTGWRRAGELRNAAGKPLALNGIWGIAFGNDGLAGPAGTLFFASGPHRWRGATELGVHGVIGSITPER